MKTNNLVLASVIFMSLATGANAMGNKHVDIEPEKCTMGESGGCGCEKDGKNCGCDKEDHEQSCGCYECQCDKGGCKSAIFKKLDKNSDGKITSSEANEFHSARFSVMDANKDGVLTKEEFMTKHDDEKSCGNKHCMKMQERMDNAFESLDTNKDGKITKKEFDAAGAEKTSKMDKNGDGKITEDEFNSARKISGKKHCGCGEGK